jgi:hypothetical protein
VGAYGDNNRHSANNQINGIVVSALSKPASEKRLFKIYFIGLPGIQASHWSHIAAKEGVCGGL